MPSPNSVHRYQTPDTAAAATWLTQSSPSMSKTYHHDDDDDDDFQIPLTQSCFRLSSQKPLHLSNISTRSPPIKKQKRASRLLGKENAHPGTAMGISQCAKSSKSRNEIAIGVFGVSNGCATTDGIDLVGDCSLELIKSTIDCEDAAVDGKSGEGFGGISEKGDKLGLAMGYLDNSIESMLIAPNVGHGSRYAAGNGPGGGINEKNEKNGLTRSNGYLGNSIECRLMAAGLPHGSGDVGDRFLEMCGGECDDEQFEVGTNLDALIKLCDEREEAHYFNGHDGEEEADDSDGENEVVCCPLCGLDISDLSDESRQIHTNDCLDKGEDQLDEVVDGSPVCSPQKPADVSPVLGWLCSLGLERYEEAFIREEIDWDCLQCLTEEDLINMGISALGPRKKIIYALCELRKRSEGTTAEHVDVNEISMVNMPKTGPNASKAVVTDSTKIAASKLITDYFPGTKSNTDKKRTLDISVVQRRGSEQLSSGRGCAKVNNRVKAGKVREVPTWCCIPGTSFRVDAFRFLRRDCSHWFLTHFHIDHYQGLTRSFSHGKIYCSAVTAKLVNMKIGIPWERLEVLPINQKIVIDGVGVTCLDANHCPGSIIILFEPPNGEAVLHTGDFRFSEEMAKLSILQAAHIHTLILDTTYCNPLHDFPKQDAVIQFVIEAIQAETFNPKTLFLIGSYTIGKERLFLEVARVLRKKVYVSAAKLRIIQCLGLSEEDMQWFTVNEKESHIHIVPMWILASFKRLKHISNQYMGRFSLIVAFSPTGWTFGKGKKSTGRRWQQGTIIRYEVPYSEHSSFSELKEFVKLISPVNIIPSVNNDGPDSAKSMISLLLS